MADSKVPVTGGSGYNVDTRTNTDGDHRQVIVLGDPSVVDNVVNVVTADPGASSTTPGVVVRLAGSASVQLVGATGSLAVTPQTPAGSSLTDEGYDAQRVLIVGSHTAGSLLISGQQVAGTNRPLIVNTDGAIKVYDVAAGTINIGNSPTITGITNSISTYISGTAGTIGVRVGQIDGTVAVYFSPSGPVVTTQGWDGSSFRTSRMNTEGAIKVYDIVNGTVKIDGANSLGTLSVYLGGTAGTLGVRVGQIDGTVAVQFSPSRPVVLADNQHTASIFILSGSTSAVSASGLTLVAPSANASFKVYGIALTTTAQVGIVAKFTNGAGTSPTEYWRYALQAPTQGIAGANIAVTPPGYIFATGTNTTLSLVLDSASLVHYSVTYFKESA